MTGTTSSDPAAMLAAATLADDAFDVAILDLELDGETSFPVADALRRRAIPFVFLTGQLAVEEIPERFAAERLLCKPVSPESLIEALESGCRASQS